MALRVAVSAGALRVAIVADDLTGALDASAPFAARGLATRVAVTPAGLDAALAGAPEVVSVNTASRHLDADEAARRVRAAAGRLAAEDPAVVLKKIDSTLRGPVAAEVAAARAVFARRALVCPAVPAQGRTVEGGRLTVDGVPLARSAAGADGRARVLEDRLPALLGPVLDRVRAVRHDAPWPADADLAPDAASEADLAALVARAAEDGGPWLFVGAAGLASALAGRLAPGGAAEAAPPRAPVLFVVGSRAARTRRQLAVLAERLPGLAVVETAAEPDEGARAVALVPPRDEAGRDPDAVAAALADEARRLMARLAPGLVVATGGDTALALLDRLGAGTIEVLGEPWPGVVRSRLGPDGATLVTKAGGFGAETLFADVAAWAGLLPGGRVEGCPLV